MERTFTVTATPLVDVHAPTAAVAVRTGEDGEVTVVVHTDHPDDWAITRAGSTIAVRDEADRSLRRRDRVEVTAPVGADVDVRTASGDVDLDLHAGRVEVATVAGDVRVAHATTLTLRTASGDARLGHVTGDLDVRSASGDVTATTVEGDLTATTAAGDVHATTVHGEVHVTTAAGDLTLDTLLGDTLRARTMAGDVTVGIPSGTSVDLDVTTLTGTVDLPAPRTAPPPDDPPRPRTTLHLRTVSGDLTLTRTEPRT